jgi:hypothetical protein
LTGKRKSVDSHFANIFYKVELKDYYFTPSDECLDLQFFAPEDIEEAKSKNEKIYFTVDQFIQEYYQ